MFVFNHRSALCLYEQKMHILRLIDASQSPSTQVSLETALLCAVVGCRDDQVFYVRLAKSPLCLGLYSRPIQGMKIGSEVLVTELSSMDPKASFDIACRDEDSAQILIIVSTEGKFQSHRLDFEEQSHLT